MGIVARAVAGCALAAAIAQSSYAGNAPSYTAATTPYTGTELWYCDQGGNDRSCLSSNLVIPLSNLLAATGVNTIANGANAQTWNWDTLTTQNALTLGSASLTTGNIIYAANTNTAATGNVVNISNNSTAGSASLNVNASGATGVNYGVYASTASVTAGAAGVAGIASGATGGIAGVKGVAASTGGYGGYFSNTAATGGSFGVLATAASTTGYAGYFSNTAATGGSFGVVGVSASATGVGGYFTNSNGGFALVTNAGFVGFGNLAPTAQLDVAGPIRSDADSYCTATATYTSNVTLAACTGMTTGTLAAGKTYAFRMHAYITAVGGSGGVQVDLHGGSATATTLIAQAKIFSGTAISTSTQVAALATAVGATAAATDIEIDGTIIVNVAGTLIPRFAQNASNATSTVIGVGSSLIVWQLN